MRTFVHFSLTFAFVLSISFINAQTTNNRDRVGVSESEQTFSDNVKAQFIKNQNYLSPSSLKEYKSFYGDSLKGFDEKAVKQNLLSSNLSATEFILTMKARKREFVNKKYHLGYYVQTSSFSLPSATPSSANSKLIGGGNNVINVYPCNNEDFESSTVGQVFGSLAVQGWTIESFNANACYQNNWSPGSPEVWIRSTPILATGITQLPTLGNSPLGGSNVIQLQDAIAGDGLRTRISQSFPVTSANTVFQFAFAGAWQDGGHSCCEQPALDIRLQTCGGTALACSSLSFNAQGSQCTSGVSIYTVSGGASWTNWQTRYIDLTPYIGQCITIQVTSGNCIYSGHWGALFFDAKCGGNVVCLNCGIPTGTAQYIAGPVSFCSGAGVAQIAAPVGYATYSWVSPNPTLYPIPPSQATLATITLTNPPIGSVYTVNMVSPSGCPFVSTNTISYTQVNIAGIGSSTSCVGGASGQATVVGNGSGTGYTYNWVNSSNVSVGSSSVATGLAAGVYSVTIAGLGFAGCGSATASVTVGSGIPATQTILTSYCGTQAYLSPPIAGSNYQWYNNLTQIPAPLGTASGYTVSSPVNNSVYRLKYTAQGCQDSLVFVLQSAPPGTLYQPVLSAVCPSLSNGTATISIAPQMNAPVGNSTFSVFSISPGTAYSSSLGPTYSNVFYPTGMPAGTYSVIAFDGSCTYGTSFILSPLVYSFSISPPTASLCPATNVVMGAVFSSGLNASQCTFSWSPSTFVANTSGQQAAITPTTAPGTTSNFVYTLTATSLNGGCQVSKTATITAFNPATPTLAPVPNLCNNSALYTISSNPPGSVYTCSIANLVSSSGVITASNIVNYGVVTYSASQTSYTCTVSNTGTFEISKYNEPDLTSGISPMCVNSGPFNLMNIVQNTVTGIWSGTGVQSSGSGNYVFNPAGLSTNIYLLTYSTFSYPNPTVCPNFTTINVSVTKTITPIITPIDPFCDNHAPITLTVNPAGGIWTGTGVSSAGVIIPGPALVPSSLLTYTVADGPCVNTNTINLSVSQFNSASLIAPMPDLCANSSNPFNLLSISSSTNGVWSGISVVSNSFNPSGLPTNTYTLTYNTTSWPNPSLCPDTRTASVFVLNPPVANITQPPTLCNTSPTLQLLVSPNTGSWVTTPYLNIEGVFNPAAAIIGNNTIQYAIGTNTCNTLQTKYLSVESFVSAATTTNSLGDKCNTGSVVNLIPIAYNSNGLWSGPGIVGASFNPNLTGTGSFILTHQTASYPSGLCPDEATLSVNVFSLATPVVSQIGPFCNTSGPIQLPVVPIGGVFGGINTSAVSPEGVFNPLAGIVGNNIINYSITSGPCVAYAQVTISIEKFVSATFTNPKVAFCKNDSPINLNSMVQNPGGTWSGNGVVGNMFTPANAVVGIPNVITYRTHSMPTETLCPDEQTINIDVHGIPNLSIVSDKSKGCSPLHISLSVETSSITSGILTWYMGDGSEPQNGIETEYTYNTPGVYHVTYNYTDDYGCRANPGELGQTIVVYDMPKVDFSGPSEISISSPDVVFTNLTTQLSSSSYSWSIPGLYQSSDINASVSFPAPGKYPVTLLASAAGGAGSCSNTVTKMIEVKSDFNVYIPNSFSPNFDHLNETFVPVFSTYGAEVQGYEMEIFDRWGHLLFRTKDSSKGWDGTVKGEAAKEEVYIYRIKFKDPDGNSYNRSGSFTLVR